MTGCTETRDTAPGAPPFPDMVWIPGGTFVMGSDNHYPEERPAHRVSNRPFPERFPMFRALLARS